MSAEGVLIESCIRRREGGTYSVQISVNWEQKRKSFKTLTEARKWRDHIKAQRPKREKRNGAPSHKAEITVRRQSVRQMLKTAPRSQREVNGRVFTVIHLPDAA